VVSTTTSRKPLNFFLCCRHLTGPRFDDRYDAEPYTYDEEELEPPPIEEREDLDDKAQLNHPGDSGASNVDGVNGVINQVIPSGDVGAAKTPGANAIPPDQRTTTPYMTKYERARILGTRALQIRYFRKLRFL
jgi:DNA-directed RNA polymerases I, II, and III subunit RPABC2